MLYPVIMAGGKGTRFWPLSREDRPKQLLSVAGETTMIQATVERLLPLAPLERIIIVAGAAHVEQIAEQLPDLPRKNIIAEPVGRNTAPCVALAAHMVAARNPEGIMAIFPADHVINNAKALIATIEQVVAQLRKNPSKLATIGISPSYPETGYGYIERGDTVSEGLYSVKRFCEKPDAFTAKRYVASGDFYWNAGMFFWRADTIIDYLARYMPELTDAMVPIATAAQTGSEALQGAVDKNYPSLPADSIDYGVMEKAGDEGEVIVAPCDPGWNDVGSWRSLYDLMEPDKAGNFPRGELIAVESKGVLTHSTGKKLIAVVGVDDVIVVETDDAILVLHKDRAQEVRQVTEELKARGRTDLL